MANDKGYWVGEEWVSSNGGATTGVALKERAGIEPGRQLIAIATDGTWSIVNDQETISPEKYEKYEEVPSFIYG